MTHLPDDISKPGLLRRAKKGWIILRYRLRAQGGRTTLLWIYGRGFPALTGVPLLRFSRITPSLLVGPQFRKRGKQLLEKHGIVASVNLRFEKDDADYDLDFPQYLYLPTLDDAAPSVEHLDQGVAFIREVINKGGKVYIHCGGGVGRAPSMAAAYLVAEGYSLEHALQKIRAVRPFINLTPPQQEQLIHYEALIRGRNGKGPAG